MESAYLVRVLHRLRRKRLNPPFSDPFSAGFSTDSLATTGADQTDRRWGSFPQERPERFLRRLTQSTTHDRRVCPPATHAACEPRGGRE